MNQRNVLWGSCLAAALVVGCSGSIDVGTGGGGLVPSSKRQAAQRATRARVASSVTEGVDQRMAVWLHHGLRPVAPATRHCPLGPTPVTAPLTAA